MQINWHKHRDEHAFTLAEMVVCFAIVALLVGGMITAYNNAALFAERAGYVLAAEGQAVQVMERARAALWDTQTIPNVDEVTNLPAVSVSILELPITGTNAIYCTNYFTVTTITNNASLGVMVHMFQVDTFWPWNGTTMSNTIVTYRAPDA